MAENAAVKKFKEKLDALREETGFGYEIMLADFDKSIAENRLYADWYDAGTTLARVMSMGDGETNNGSNLVFEVAGSLSAQLRDKDGALVHEFRGFITPFSNDEVSLESDKDLSALIEGKHKSGYTLTVENGNKICIYAEDRALDPITVEDPSVARAILNEELVRGLMARADEEAAEAENDMEGAFGTDSEEDEARRMYGEALDRALDSIGNDGIISPDKPLDDDDAFGTEPSDEQDEDEEAAEAEEEAAPKKAPAKAKSKSTGKTAKAAKKPAKKESAASEDTSVPRYDLLPLDFIDVLIAGFGEDRREVSFFSAIEQFKKDNTGMIDAAISFAKANYESVTDAVTALAVVAERDAEENGEDGWKSACVMNVINMSIKHYLDSLGGDEEGIDKAFWGLVTCAWLEANR